MGYKPITEDQAQRDAKEQRERFLPWSAGDYDFIIKSSMDAGFTRVNTSGQSYPMIALEVAVFNQDGKEKVIKDSLILGGVMAFKFRHAALACGLQAAYEGGTLKAFMLANKRGKAHLVITPKQAKKDPRGNIIPGEFWPEKNTIEDYVTEGVTQEDAAPTIDPELDDEVPF